MAKILYEVKQNQNSHSTAYAKWFAQVKSLETLNTRKMAQHISEHGSIYTPDVVYGVLEKFRSCLIEMLLNSKKVKIEGLGTFYCTLENKKHGAPKKEDYNVREHINGLHIRFLPEQTTEENISSREFLKKAEFILVDNLHSLTPNPSPTGEGSENSGGGTNSGGSTNNSGGSGSNTNDDDNPADTGD
jgi:predicted histone-like DNA-binding protein